MFKIVLHMLAGAILVSAVGVAIAQTAIPSNLGRPPLPYGDEALIDQKWLYGLAGGLNNIYQYGIAAAGSSSHANSTQLPNNIALFSIDTVGANSGVSLPTCIQGIAISLYNNTATNLIVYPAIVNNPVTAAQDTINNTTSVTVNAHTSELFFCPKTGVWGAK